MEEETHSSSVAKEEVEEFPSFDPTKKKKKKQHKKRQEDHDTDEFLQEQGSNPNYEALRDYDYEELLGMMVNRMRENNPEYASKQKTRMSPPQVLLEGKKKTIFVNFLTLCKQMHRQPEHVMSFLLAELGTTGSIDGQQRLTIKYKLKSTMVFEGLLRRYIEQYVKCNACPSIDTLLSKEDRLYFVRCEKCGSGRTVERIESGFDANARRERRRAGL
ncbi:hypothetical protein ACHQM5_001532 [Ranunculus cassubicifolius]